MKEVGSLRSNTLLTYPKLGAKKSILNIATLVILVVNFNAYADYELVKGKYGELYQSQ